jgi:hypothetical protein
MLHLTLPLTHDQVFFVCCTELLAKVFFVCYSQLVTRYFLYVTLDIGEEVIGIDTPPKMKQCASDWAAAYFLTKTLKGYTVNHYSKGSKNCINVVFHKGCIPSERVHPVMSLNQGGNASKLSGSCLSISSWTSRQRRKQSPRNGTMGTRTPPTTYTKPE